MENERWFPLKHELPDGSRLGQLLHSGCNWQIYRLNNQKLVLIVQSALAHRWMESRLLPDTVWNSLSFGQDDYRAITSNLQHRLEPVVLNRPPDTKADALSFALSLRETRKIDADVPLHDAIYMERYSRLLPTWTSSEGSTDEEILGQWLTGGVSIPATSFRRMSSILGWLDKRDVADLVVAAGFSVPKSSGIAGTAQKSQQLVAKQEGAEAPTTAATSGSAAGSKSSIHSHHSQQAFRLSGRPVLETFFNEHVIDIIENAECYRALGIDFPAAIVLYGPPGCGKTFAVERLGEYLDWPIFPIDSSSIASPYIHETSKKVGQVFDQAMDAAPSMIIIDEMESYLSDRQIHRSTGLHHVEEVAEFLRRIPEASKRQVLVIGMTNRLEMIDSAILRRGRFDHVIEVGMPSATEVADLMDALLTTVPIEGRLDTGAVVTSLTGRALSDTAFVVREARRQAARAGRWAVDNESLQRALASLQSTARQAAVHQL
ncbi:MAG: ATPase AAA [Candidatus Synechococcus spongiarum 15L]|uniref:AAA family ATPase n=2 Tax=Candidatus Synechococcus spongiarum TaxID=431041 RepID=A0A1T1D2Y8_9SYNE|nr:MAG: ATPase AAA [Candidatus Synechococcus spongiarum 15L]OOV35211.1 AAA family ATPase [Candidatus Synechococcus spongiarum LMB bulk15M]